MGVASIVNAFTAGELSPSMLGRQDVAKYHVGASTMRNVFCSYRGPAYSRPGTAFCGFSMQTGRDYPPRLIPFQFNVNQGLALEFGNFYMRVLFDGAFVTEAAAAITGVTNASPAFIAVQTETATAAVAVDTLVSASYRPNDTVTLAGGVFTTPATITINTVKVLNVGAAALGSGYVPGDTINLAGGTGTNPVVTATTTQVASATVTAAGTGGTPGAAIVTGTTGVGTKFQANVTINGSGNISAVNSITLGGAYTTNPTTLTAEPVTGGGLAGATLHVVMGIGTLAIVTAGVMTAIPAGGVFTQASTSGAGTGATVLGTLFAPVGVTLTTAGSYTSPPPNPAQQGSTSGTGVGVQFTMTYTTSGSTPVYANGDWVYISGLPAMPSLNGRTVVVGGTTNGGFNAYDVYGNPISTVGEPLFAGSPLAARVYTLATQWAEEDLPWLKFQESADFLSICCVNQETGVEYPPVDLERITDSDWQFVAVVPSAPLPPPASLSGTTSSTGSVFYEYEVTAIAGDGTESIASPVAQISNAVDIAATAGTNKLTWSNVPGAIAYYVYKASPGYSTSPPVGAEFGFAGQALGLQFIDSNITPDFTQVPPQHRNPFARGQVLEATPTAGGTGYTQATVVMNTTTGTGAVIQGVVVSGAVVAYIIEDPGKNYGPNDTGTVHGDGTGATVSVTVGPQSGTYPSVVNYFQERRAYANSLNNPDTYWMSQPGSFSNYDVRNPTIASDAITGSPWSVQVNGIQWLIQTPAGLLVMTGLSAWLLAGVGSFATNVQAISPSNQADVPQAFSGCSPLISPIRINYDVVYLTSKGSFYYVLPYQLYQVNEPIDITEVSSHLFLGFTIVSHAWCEQPDKLLWAVRSDGVLLSMTYYKAQQVAGWARHDTKGTFVSNCSVVELPVDAHYLATERFVGSTQQCYMIERMANRTWNTVEEAWCVDAGLQYPQPQPAAMLSLSSPISSGTVTNYSSLVGGSGYSAGTTFTISDTDGGQGSGATATGTIVGGAITALTITNGGSDYQFPAITAYDPAGSAGGSGFSAHLLMRNPVTLEAATPIFSSGDVGSIVRAGGGVARIIVFNSSTVVTASLLTPFPTVPNSGGQALTFASGEWTMTAPVTTVTGLDHLDGQTVTGLADGNVIPPMVVENGAITLPTPASAIIVGMGFTAQLQSMPLELGQPTAQGQRKDVQVITARLEASLGVTAVANQVDGSILSPEEIDVEWEQGSALPDAGPGAQDYMMKPYNALATPLWTGDRRAAIQGGLSTRGQIALIQNNPLPMNVLALIPEIVPGDTPQATWPQKQGRK